jgi:hypothetical protein
VAGFFSPILRMTAMRAPWDSIRASARLLTLLVAAGACAAAESDSAPDNGALRQSIPVYSVLPSDSPVAAARIQVEQAARIQRLQSGAFGAPEDFNGRASIVFKTEKRPMVESRAFALVTSSGVPPGGWHQENRVFTWRETGGVSASVLALPLKVDERDQPFHLGDYDQVWVEYSIAPSVAPCIPRLELTLAIHPTAHDAGDAWHVLARTSAWPALNVLTSLDPTKFVWKEKGFAYLARRELGLPPDDEWR